MIPISMMILKILLLSLGLATCYSKADVPNNRIIGGYIALIREYPYVASIQIDQNHVCGGVIVTKQQVLTSAFCVDKVATEKITVRLGSWTHAGTEGEIFGVLNVIQHPNFNSNLSRNYDIALLNLNGNIIYSNITKSVKIETEHYPNRPTLFTTAGWGVQKLNAIELSDNIRSINLYDYFCMDIQKESTMACAKVLSYQQGVCYGDAGNLMVNAFGKLVGIVSWGKKCGDLMVYTNITAVQDFLDQNLASEKDDNNIINPGNNLSTNLSPSWSLFFAISLLGSLLI